MIVRLLGDNMNHLLISAGLTMIRQRGSCPTAVSERALIVWKWKCGLTPRIIAEEVNTSLTTVYRWIRRWKQSGSVRSRPRTGRPRVSVGERLRGPAGVTDTQLVPSPSTGVFFNLQSYSNHQSPYHQEHSHHRMHSSVQQTELLRNVNRYSPVYFDSNFVNTSTRNDLWQQNYAYEVNNYYGWGWQ